VATVVAVAVSYIGRSNGARLATTTMPVDKLAHSSRVDRTELNRLIGAFENQVQTRPSAAGYSFLGQMYLTRGRQSGDVQTYVQAQTALQKAVQLAPGDVDSRGLLASVSYTMHDFAGAAAQARQLLAERPDATSLLATLGDAQLEAGDYQGAAASYDQLATHAGDAAGALVRQARLAFIEGRVDEARRLAGDAKRAAVQSAFGDTGLAFYTTFQGQVELDSGQYAASAKFYEQALKEAPGYYVALAGLARSQAAQGHTAEAIKRYQQAIAVVPQPDYLAALGDLYALSGDTTKAAKQYGTVDTISKLAQVNQQVYNRLVAVFEADHDRSLDEALRLTDAELSVRHDIYGYDASAWALYKSGRYQDAKDASNKALAKGTPDAKLWYHAGLIDEALGAHGTARAELQRALEISPQFDPLQAPKARGALDRFGAGDAR
jgi:tetratricopeptide (TPR) repeat protein